jgi:hypothetical protein
MQKRKIYIGLGVLAFAAALALPVVAGSGVPGQPWGAGRGWMTGGPRVSQNARPVTSIDAAAARTRQALASYGATDLVVAEVMEFSNHFYVLVKERSTGVGAIEIIVERNGFVHPEHGPTMMWNTKYGQMRGFGGAGPRGPAGRGYGPGMMGRGYGPGPMMGGRGYGFGPGGPGAAVPPSDQQIAKDRARQIATRYLGQALPGTAPDAGVIFYGYFTFDVERGGTPVGMLSVNASTGQVWYHTWHGTFVAEKDF